MASDLVMEKSEPVVVSSFICFVTILTIFLLGWATGTFKYNVSVGAWSACVATGIFTSVALFSLMKGIKIVGSTTATVLSTVEPVPAVLLSAIIFFETMTVHQFIGILVGAVLVVKSKNS